ncbi:MAG: hypothetical protein ACYTG5_14990 [Planctomycetota bacterium]|jgi:hypothetical protein
MNLAAKTLAISLSIAAGLAAQSNYGTACVGSNGKNSYLSYPASSWLATPSTGETVTLVDGVAGAPVILWFGRNPANVVNVDLTPIGMPGCFQLVNPMWTRNASAMGSIIGIDEKAEFPLPAAPFGEEFAFQALFLDTVQGRAIPVSASNGLIAKMPANQPTFRVDSVSLADPHPFIFQFICIDGSSILNPALATFLTTDGDGDQLLDASLMFSFRPLDPSGSGGFIDFVLPDCTAPIGSTVCTLPSIPELRVSYSNQSAGNCLGVIGGTTDWPVTTPSGPCFVSDPIDLVLDINGVVIPLQEAQIAGTYVGGATPTAITDGLVRGFLPEVVANNTFIPASIPFVGGLSLANLFPGGANNCAQVDARDTGPDGQTQGWWVYVNYTASAVPVIQ